MSDGIRFTVEGSLARITIDRPPLNVLSTAMLTDLQQALERAAGDTTVHLIRLDAVGKMFSAGVDVADHVGERIAPMMQALTRLFETLDAIATPTVAVVHGAALGGGCELVLATDLCFASERTSFGQPEIRLGLFAPPASVLLPRLIGERRALELLLSGETLAAEDAERFGIVNRVFAHDQLEQQVQERLNQLLELSGCALRQAKHAVRAARGLTTVQAHRQLEQLYIDELMRTTDANEGMKAFMEKREPVFRGV